MKITPIDVSDIPETGNGNQTKHRIRQIEAFLASGVEAAEVTDFSPVSARNVANSLADSARRHGYRCTAVSRGERVFLLRTDRNPSVSAER